MKGIKNLLGGLLLVIILIILDREIGEEKPMQKKNTGKWMLFCILSLALLGLLNKCVNAQQVPIFYGALRQGILGQTVCNKKNEIAVIINDGYGFDTLELASVIEHELIHVSQIRAISGGDCEMAAKEYARNPLAKEIPAYCPEIKRRVRDGDAAIVIKQFVTHMILVYGEKHKLTYEGVLRQTEDLCLSRRSHDSS